MAKLIPEIKDYIREIVSDYEGNSSIERNRTVIESVKDRFNVVVDSKDIYDVAIRLKKVNDTIQELNEIVGDYKSYEVVNDNYVFIQDGKSYTIPVEEVDRMFYDFSRHGGNLSWETMLQKYELKPQVWHMVKNRLRLYKDSNVISPYTAENTPEEKLDEIIEEASIRHRDTIKSRMVKTHEVLWKAESARAIRTLSNVEYFLDNIRRYLTDYKPKEIEFVEYKENKNYPPLTIAMSDFHFGKKGTSEIVERIGKIKNYILSQPNSEVQILSLGDLAEALVEGGMHPWQESSMELVGIDLMLFISELFESFLIDIYNSGKRVTFNWIWGNHDRLWKTHSEDMKRTWALVIYEFIKRGLSASEIDVNIIRDKIYSYNYWPNRFIIAHWDDNFSWRKPEDVLWKNWDSSRHNIILFWDKHNATVKETKWATMVGLPALAWKWEYDTRLDLHSESGFVVVTPNEEGSVDVQIRRLK